MKTFILLILLAIFVAARSATVTFNMADFATGVITNREFQLTPQSAPFTNPPSTVITKDRKSYWTDSAGSVTVTNMTPGTYLCALLGPFTKTEWHVCVPDGTNSYSAIEIFCEPSIAILTDPNATVLKADP